MRLLRLLGAVPDFLVDYPETPVVLGLAAILVAVVLHLI